jgi:hypothetical protein
MREIYLCWVDDVQGFVSSYNGHIDMLQQEHGVVFVVDEHYNTRDFDSIARNIDDAIYLVDYNLKGNNGEGINGDELIKMIRQHSNKCPIIFYSSNATQQELRSMVAGLPNIFCMPRESLKDVLTDIVAGEFMQGGDDDVERA